LPDVALQTGIYLWFMHDDASPHFLLAVWEFLKNVFLDQLVGRGGPTYWPARFPYLNSLDLYLWGHPGSTVYVTEFSDVQNTERI